MIARFMNACVLASARRFAFGEHELVDQVDGDHRHQQGGGGGEQAEVVEIVALVARMVALLIGTDREGGGWEYYMTQTGRMKYSGDPA